jgi:hypothetical protein
MRANLHREYHLRDIRALDAEMKRQNGRLRKEPCRWPTQATKSPSAADQLKNLHPHATRVLVLGGDHRLVHAQSAGLADINTLEADFCVEALNEAVNTYGVPEIMNTDSHTIDASSRVV